MFSNGKHSTVRGSISGSFGAISFILNSNRCSVISITERTLTNMKIKEAGVLSSRII